MKTRTVIMDTLEYLAWTIGIVHIPKLDNIEEPPEPVQRTKKVETVTESEDKEEGVETKFFKWGSDELNKTAPVVGITIEEVEEFNWMVARKIEGRKKNDFTGLEEWHETDTKAIEGLSENDKDIYLMIREDVILGLTNKEIGEKHSYTKRWGEIHGARVRAAFKERLNPSPKTTIGVKATE